MAIDSTHLPRIKVRGRAAYFMHNEPHQMAKVYWGTSDGRTWITSEPVSDIEWESERKDNSALPTREGYAQ